ncbi:glycine-rich domain-containing protein [Actinokineospora soli]|uniref:Glycine-rich domain-containing protein n=1 Tax=Actinokineospora soli TaxID=1048753 RepID=A0ABW2TPJ1_9PSEU
MSERATGRALVSDELFDKLVRRIVADEAVEHGVAERIMDQALAFLSACAANTGRPLSPSDAVDIGWHTFILHTKDYAEFCEQVAGRFIHHVPTEDGDPSTRGEGARATLMRTVEAIERRGFDLDPDLWPQTGAKCQRCTQCHNGCADDPPPLTA